MLPEKRYAQCTVETEVAQQVAEKGGIFLLAWIALKAITRRASRVDDAIIEIATQSKLQTRLLEQNLDANERTGDQLTALHSKIDALPRPYVPNGRVPL